MRRSFAVVVAIIALATQAFGVVAAETGTTETYVVLYRGQSTTSDATTRIQRAGGTLVANYREIGIVIARSDSTSFRSTLLSDSRIEGVVASTQPVASLDPLESATLDGEGALGNLPNAPATDSDPLSGLQWDMRQIHTPEAHAITGGSPLVVVGDIDTGLDWSHPDLAPNIDFSRSVSCESGAPVQDPAAWDDHAGHGTHTAGTIAAAANGIGIVGVAPNVKIAGIKSSNDDGFFFAEMVICSFYWAATHQIDVTNNSYFMDPWLYNCRNDPEQRLLYKAAQRAVKFAQQNGVTVVASQGNDSDDRAHPAWDIISPDFPPGSEEEREITNACVVVPLEIPGVIGVTAVGNARQTDGDDDPDDFLKSYYSAYGIGVAALTAPGGDSRYGLTAEAPNGRVLSTYPAEVPCVRRVTDPGTGAAYCYLQGTSMAGPHVAGVAALIISRYGNDQGGPNGKMAPGAVASRLRGTADAQPCPTALPAGYELVVRPAPAGETGAPQECEGGPQYNSWYGSGQVNALRAVTNATGN